MAISHRHHQQQQEEQQEETVTTQEEQNFTFLLDALYCEEEKWEDDEEEVLQVESTFTTTAKNYNPPKNHSFPLFLLEQDLFWEDEELLSLFTKEKQESQQTHLGNVEIIDSLLSIARQEAVEWMLKVIAHHGFSTLTAILAINYLDRFLFSSYYQKDKPWMIQLVAVTCLSLAAKVEETQMPLLLDLQVEGTKYVFEAKTIQRMELLVLSTLKWKMHPVTPLSFLDHIIRRIGLKTNLHWEFLRRCESLLLPLVSDSRSINYLPSVLATATMMHVIDQVEPFNPIDYQNQLLGVLKINKEKINDCCELILDVLKTQKTNNAYYYNKNSHKRKFEEPMPSSPSGVVDAVFSSDSSNDSWALGSNSVSVPSSPPEPPLFKKGRTQDQMVFVDILGSPH